MTGYGKAEATYNGKKIHIEVKSLNSKNIRKFAAAELERGKVELTIWCEKGTEQAGLTINPSAVASYLQQMQTISIETPDLAMPNPSELWNILVRLPELTQSAPLETVSDEEWEVVSTALKQAICRLREFRRQEGEALAQKFFNNIDSIEALMKSIEPFEKSRVEKIRTRLEERIAELPSLDLDKNRLEQELIYYIEKLDINEEKQRLTNHLNYFRETLSGPHGQGKKLGFIAQEMGREINTTGSKSNQAEMQNIVVKMKDELEQIKEQVLNVL